MRGYDIGNDGQPHFYGIPNNPTTEDHDFMRGVWDKVSQRIGVDASDPALRERFSGNVTLTRPQTLGVVTPPAPARATASPPAVRPPRTPEEKYAAEFALYEDEFKAAGIALADYVASRRIDDGLDELKPAGKAATANGANWLASALN